MTSEVTKWLYEDWERALHKAWKEGIFLVDHDEKPGTSLCLSLTQLRNNKFVPYEVNFDGCSCPARTPCKHRALWLFEHAEFLASAVELPSSTVEVEQEDISA